ncbi:MAG TPA: transporter, partial [Methylomirabilota bacterium]|nr:transporter [Methylomirabilota bacterium]
LYGAPALTLEEFQNYKPDWVIGASVRLGVPLGQYESDKLVNIGANRWSVKPEIGISKTWNDWTLELSPGVIFFTDNDDFLGGKTREQDPIYAFQAHLSYTFRPGMWAAIDGTYYGGGRTTVDGVEGNDLQSNTRIGATFSMPLSQQHSLKLYASTGVSTRTGTDFQVVGIAWQIRWGGRTN